MKTTFLALILAIAWSVACVAQSADVNAERVSMDMQMLQALDGTSSVGSMGVWPQGLQTLQNQSMQQGSAFGAYVADYYAPILAGNDTSGVLRLLETDSRFRALRYADATVRVQGDASMMMQAGYYDHPLGTGSFLLARPSIRIMGSINENLGFFLDLSNGKRLSGQSSMIALVDPALSRIAKFSTEDTSFFDRYVGYIQYQSEHLRVRFGREPIQFGFSPIDNMVHSIDAPLLDGLLIDVPFKSVRFTTTHSAANGTDTAGNVVPTKFVATHRIAFDPAPWISVAVSDMIVYWGRGLDLVYLNPLAFFVSAGLSTKERNRDDNSMISFDAAVRPFPGTMLYGTWFVDDLNFATIGDTSRDGNTNKWAWQFGASQLIGTVGKPWTSMVSAEYVRIDPFTYSHRTMNASYTTFNAPLGYNMQPNSDRLAVQWRTWLTPRTFIRLDLDYTRHGENRLDSNGNIEVGDHPYFPGNLAPVGNVGADILRGDGDGVRGARFLAGVMSYQRRLRLWLSAELWHNIFTDVRIGYTSRTGGNSPEQFFSGTLEFRIGY